MTDTDPGEEATLFPKTAGERLREAREGQGLSLAEIAARTRIPIRQLEAIEASNYAALPSITYSVGFAKAYARAVGADEVAIARDVRSQSDQTVRRTDYEAYEITDPSRVPTNGIALAGLAVAVLLLIAAGLWYGTTRFRGEEAAQSAPIAEATETPQPVPTAAAPVPAPVTSAQVVLTATDVVWLRVYDAAGKTLFENTLKPGDRYVVPGDANGPMINVGRPDKLEVTVNGSAVPPLGSGKVAIKDVGISAAALAARATTTPAATSPSAVGPQAPRHGGQEGQAAPAPPLNIAAHAPVAGKPAAPSGGATPAPAP